jgi:hypothetical protein
VRTNGGRGLSCHAYGGFVRRPAAVRAARRKDQRRGPRPHDPIESLQCSTTDTNASATATLTFCVVRQAHGCNGISVNSADPTIVFFTTCHLGRLLQIDRIEYGTSSRSVADFRSFRTQINRLQTLWFQLTQVTNRHQDRKATSTCCIRWIGTNVTVAIV